MFCDGIVVALFSTVGPQTGHSWEISMAALSALLPLSPKGDERPAFPIMARSESFQALYDEHVDMVWRALRRLGVPEGSLEDGVQEVFVVAHRKFVSFEGRSSESTWLYGIAVMVARNVRRHARRHPESALEPAHEESLVAAPPDETLLGQEASAVVEQLLATLSEEKREVFVLAELEELPGPEIAKTLGINTNTMYARLRAARQAFEEAAHRWRTREAHGARRTT
jgi:RNA polymerase sigma-70 factor, ECF subfamily